MVSKTKYPKHANKRSEDQREHDRQFAIKLAVKGFTHREIADILHQETGRKLSRRQVGYDIQKVRERWLNEQIEEYDYLIKEELLRLSALEEEMWEAWRASKSNITQERVEKIARQAREEAGEDIDDDELVSLMVSKVVTTTTDSVGDKGFLELIFKTQQERRKLLGLYSPARLNIDVREEKTLNIKGYHTVSPDDWPDQGQKIIDGEWKDAG